MYVYIDNTSIYLYIYWSYLLYQHFIKQKWNNRWSCEGKKNKDLPLSKIKNVIPTAELFDVVKQKRCSQESKFQNGSSKYNTKMWMNF